MLKRKKQIIAKVMATTMLATTLATTFVTTAEAASVGSTTIAGSDRYETAIKISENGWSSATNAVLINGEKGLVDALTATPYASLKDAPILITNQDNLTTSTLNRLKAMKVKHVDIVGGVNSVSDKVVTQLKSNGMTVNRISGSSRYETGLAVAKEIDKISNISKIAVVNGEKGLPDAVSVAAPAADNKMPIILAHPTNGIDAATKTFINGEGIYKSYVIGSTSSMPDSIANTLPGTKTRLGGSDRHDTNAKVIKEFYPQTSLDNIYVAKSGHVVNENELVDALAAGVLAAKNDDPVLLAGKTLGTTQESMLKEKKFTKMTQIGGNIPTATLNSIKATQEDPEAQVSGVKVVGAKTLEITGKELNRIDNTKVSISGNTVDSYAATSDGTKATVTFTKVFENGTNTLKVLSNLGTTTNHTFTFNSAISKVEATTSEVGLSGLQYLEFTVNDGQKRTVSELKELGWKVEFESTESVFYVNSSENAKVSSDGKLKTNTPFTDKYKFIYKVTLTKGDEKVVSNLKEVTAKEKRYKEIKSFDFVIDNGVKVANNKLSLQDTVSIANVKAIDAKGDVVDVNSDIELTSKNNSIIAPTSDHKLKPQKSGSTTVVITLPGNITKEVTMTVGEAVREAKTISLSTSEAKITTGATVTVKATVKDQYDAAVKGIEIADGNAFINDSAGKPTTTSVATVTSVGNTTTEGMVDLTVEANKGKTGTGYFDIKVGDNKFTTLKVTVSDDKTVNSWQLQTEVGSDAKLDLYDKVNNDTTVRLKLNGYNKAGQFVETQPIITTQASTNTNISTNSTVVTYDNENAVLNATKGIVTAKKVGKTVLTPYINGKKHTAITIDVIDTTPEMIDISLKNVDDITTTGTLNIVKDVFNSTELTADKIIVKGITGKNGIDTREVLIDDSSTSGATLFLKENDGVTNTTVGTIKVETNTDFNISNISNISITSTGDKEKYILVKVFKGTDTTKNPIATKEIKVKVK